MAPPTSRRKYGRPCRPCLTEASHRTRCVHRTKDLGDQDLGNVVARALMAVSLLAQIFLRCSFWDEEGGKLSDPRETARPRPRQSV